jgi:hypothetical protein
MRKVRSDRYKYGTGQLFSFAPNSYFDRTSRPIYALVFLLPFIIFYELGTIFINTDVLSQTQIRVVAFVWLQDFLEYLGFGAKLAWAAPAVAVVVILVALQIVSHKKWQFGYSDTLPMAIECILLATPLIILSLVLNSSVNQQKDAHQFDTGSITAPAEITYCAVIATNNAAGAGAEKPGVLANIVTGIGAGIYEELIFRLILICALMIFFQDFFKFEQTNAIILAVLVSAALFSAHHHIVFLHGQFGTSSPFNWTEFTFRTVAGVYFAFLFAIRGFGITAGTHAFYDIIATLINAVFFQW